MGGATTFAHRTGNVYDWDEDPPRELEWVCNDLYMWEGKALLAGDVLKWQGKHWVVTQVVPEKFERQSAQIEFTETPYVH